jgi:hypothetical protein
MRRLTLWMAIAAIVASATACTANGDVQVSSAECVNVPSSVCDTQVRLAANAAGGQVAGVSVACRIDACTRAHGAGDAIVTRADGTHLTRSWSYVGDDGPVPVPVCIGIAEALCQREVNGSILEVPVEKRLTGVTVTCKGACDATSGAVEIVFESADGTKTTLSSGWEE